MLDDVFSAIVGVIRLFITAVIYIALISYSPAMLIRRLLIGKWGLRDFDDSIGGQFLWGILGVLSWAAVIYAMVMIIN